MGIEFSLKFGWSDEEVVYDFVKLLDAKNPFKAAISLNLILRLQGLTKGRNLEYLHNHMNDAFKEATRRLGSRTCERSRKLYFIVTEIDRQNGRRHWHFDGNTGQFAEGLSSVADS